jgi:hypothetical protein
MAKENWNALEYYHILPFWHVKLLPQPSNCIRSRRSFSRRASIHFENIILTPHQHHRPLRPPSQPSQPPSQTATTHTSPQPPQTGSPLMSTPPQAPPHTPYSVPKAPHSAPPPAQSPRAAAHGYTRSSRAGRRLQVFALRGLGKMPAVEPLVGERALVDYGAPSGGVGEDEFCVRECF